MSFSGIILGWILNNNDVEIGKLVKKLELHILAFNLVHYDNVNVNSHMKIKSGGAIFFMLILYILFHKIQTYK